MIGLVKRGAGFNEVRRLQSVGVDKKEAAKFVG